MKKILAIGFVAIGVLMPALATDYATTESGMRVQLNDDGTWSEVAQEKTTSVRNISFSDYLIDSDSLEGEMVRIRGVGGFSNDSGESRPDGAIYQQTFTIGPSIRISTASLDRGNLSKAHECPLSCALEISGKVDRSKYGATVIRAESVRILEKGASML